MPDIKDIYYVEIFFEGISGRSKVRPVLIINKLNNGKYTIVEITSVSPRKPPKGYDIYKEEITNWYSYGLKKLSFVKCTNVINVRPIRFLNKIGIMYDEEFENIVNKIIEYN